ncbi:serine/threonine protein phosphatase [Amylibacter marinus]|uniref:Serine/threonine protein phosphatase n=1 Tax=Amylibacter marinus TaxID=1475483 RepID=A0ABQ5VWU7_9RHOB|nr:metallophosphoesterase [Amylibacter marinus]GLQ35835.1 serine/threonine protein phosphatase [Amylibacter marinus]
MTDTFYAIGDIHGDLVQLKQIHARITEDISRHAVENYKIIHIGDLVDRRPDSKGVIDYLMAGIERGEPWIVLKGNHDRLFQWFFEDYNRKDANLRPDYDWLTPRMGGRDTLRSYFIEVAPEGPLDKEALLQEAKIAVPQAHLDFIKNLPLSFETDHFFFCHAGINLDRPLNEQSEDDLLWIRKNWLENPAPAEKMIIHGHTIVPEVSRYINRINIDTGAAYGDVLSAVVVQGDQVLNLLETGRAPIKYA